MSAAGNKGNAPKRPHGQIRQSQVVTTFGPGSMVDLPRHSVLIGGLEYWTRTGAEIHEPRLVAKARDLVGPGDLRLYPPPPESTDPAAKQTGITVFQFPEWFIVRDSRADDRMPGAPAGRSRLLVQRRAVPDGYFLDANRKKREIVPVRFVRSCRRGHLGDIDWYAFVHREGGVCKRQLRIEESGTTGDISEVIVSCACGESRPMAEAAMSGLHALGMCDGARPWLGPRTRERCDEPNRLLVRTASNAYFPQILSVIALPEEDEAMARAIDSVWEHHVQYVEDMDDLKRERNKKPPVAAALEGYEDERVLAMILARRQGKDGERAASVKEAEIRVLTVDRQELGADHAEGDFHARRLERDGERPSWMRAVEKVVLVDRLREVRALVGFSRFEPIGPDAEGELDIGVRRAALARDTTWLPAVENRGEGIFLEFDAGAIDAWVKRDAVQERGRRLLAGFDAWRHQHPGTRRQFPGVGYVLLHSLSHMLITSVSLECGYPASSIRERIYAGAAGYGILLFTGTPDAEGTLGGLVEIGRSIDRHVRSALEGGTLCSNDPVCAQHDPVNELVRRFLCGAACHGCLLIAETSCEMQNDFLDRALVVPTVDRLGAEFFEGDGWA